MKNDFGRYILKGVDLPFESHIVERVTERFFTYDKPEKVCYSSDGRYMNHFCVGADPEFMFLQEGGLAPAMSFGLKSGLAFGADQNERLVELRAAPARDVVTVLASVLASLRWLYRYLGSEYRDLTWVAPAFLHGDGMGGHVHFGRKRPNREDEVKGLDGLARIMRACDLFDSDGWTRRCQGDQFHQMYGQYGDIREQKHGYEYRTLPTWLDNPRLAYLVLVLSKLVIIDPDITASWQGKTGDPNRRVSDWDLLRGLAKYYKGRDDDALLLYSMMDVPDKFQFVGGDFRLRWGLSGVTNKISRSSVIPAVIEATAEDTMDLLKYLGEGKKLEMRECAPNFKNSVPAGYEWVPTVLEYRRRPNIGDIFYDMVTHSSMPIVWDFESNVFSIHTPVGYDRAALNKLMTEGDHGEVNINGTGGSRWVVRIGHQWRKGAALAHLRKVLYSGLLPIWKVDEVTEESFGKWSKILQPVKIKKKINKYVEMLKAGV
jgi:hypothetical protein